MKKRLPVLLCLSLLSLPLFAQTTKAEMQEMYMNYMKSEGISATVDEDGDIKFTWEGERFNEMTYYIIIDENDTQFFRILKSGGYSLENETERQNAYIAAAVVNRSVQPAKINVQSTGNNVDFSAEALLVSPGDFAAIFPRLMNNLERAMDAFVKEME